MPDPTGTEEGGSSSNEEDQTMSTAMGTLSSQELIEQIRNRVRRQVVEEFLSACGGDEQKKTLILELSAQVLGERIAPPTVVERFSSLNEEDSSSSSSSSSNDDSSDQDNLKWGHVVAMESITQSPYEPGASAEVGEEIFEAFEDLMVPEKETKNLQRRCLGIQMEPSKQAIKVLGRETSQILIAARYHISQSGMLFSTDWLNQRIRGVEVKGMNKLIILVSLPEQRISRAEKCVLTSLVQHLRLADIIREVLDDLVGMGASTQFPQLADCMETPFPYRRSQQTECQKCEIFVARAYTCMNYMKRDTIENETMIRKIFDCLSIMEENLDFEASTPHLHPPIFIDVRQPVVAGLHVDDGSGDGCDDRSVPLPAGEKAIHERSSPSGKETMAIEQLELDSGRVIKRWDSILEANTYFGKGKAASDIRDNLAGTRKEAYGYCWRKAAGSNALPSSKALNIDKGKCHIEKLDLQTGLAIASYASHEEANISLGRRATCSYLKSTLDGRYKSTGGFFWRFAGSNTSPGTGIAASLESHAPHRTAPQTAAPRTGTGIANSSAVVSQESHVPHQKAPQTATSRNKERSISIQPLVQKSAIGHATCSSIDQESEVPRVCTVSVPNNLNDDAPRASGSLFSDAGNTNRRVSNELAISRKRLSTDGNVVDEIPFRKKVKPGRPVEIADGDRQVSDAPTGIPLSSYSGRPSTRIISAMTDINESPYQESATAEIGEEIFDRFKSLLQPEGAPGCRHPKASLDAVDVFGSSALANAVIEASSKIALSGMTYSDQWTEENTYGLSIKGVPKPVLLLLLQEQRFSRPNAMGALKKIVDEFDLCKKMIEALVRWKLAGKYSKLVTAKNHTAFGTQLPQCYKCLIFIARALICVETLKIEELPESIQRKVESCFEILQRNFGSRPQPRRLAMGVDHAVNVDEDEKSNVSGFDCSSPLRKITESSHVLFQVQQVAAASTTIPSVVNAPLSPKVTSPVVHSNRKSSGTILQEKSHALSSWVPHDSEEVILKPLECEVAWLVEEARYCLRDRATVHWRFLWKYASPALRVELRRVQDGGNPSLEQLVRLQDKIVSERFSTLRRDVRRKILKGNSRPRMKQAIDSERLTSWQSQEKKNLASSSS